MASLSCLRLSPILEGIMGQLMGHYSRRFGNSFHDEVLRPSSRSPFRSWLVGRLRQGVAANLRAHSIRRCAPWGLYTWRAFAYHQKVGTWSTGQSYLIPKPLTLNPEPLNPLYSNERYCEKEMRGIGSGSGGGPPVCRVAPGT